MSKFNDNVVELPTQDGTLITVMLECDTWDEFCEVSEREEIEVAIRYLTERGFRVGLQRDVGV